MILAVCSVVAEASRFLQSNARNFLVKKFGVVRIKFIFFCHVYFRVNVQLVFSLLGPLVTVNGPCWALRVRAKSTSASRPAFPLGWPTSLLCIHFWEIRNCFTSSNWEPVFHCSPEFSTLLQKAVNKFIMIIQSIFILCFRHLNFNLRWFRMIFLEKLFVDIWKIGILNLSYTLFRH